MKKHNFNFPKIVSNFQDKVDIHVRTYRVKNGKVISPVDEYLVNILPTVPGESFINKGTNQLYLNVCLGENDKSIEEKIAQSLKKLPDSIKTIYLSQEELELNYTILASEVMLALKNNWSAKKQEKELINRTIEINGDVEKGVALGKVKSWVQKVVSMPANYLTPENFAKEVDDFISDNQLLGKLNYTAYDEEWVLNEQMGSFYAVAKGSHEKLKFLELIYNGGKEGEQPLVLVGKGITFDTGGISLKPSKGMGDMKGDMAGAASVCASIFYAALLDLPLNVVSLAPCCENMPDGKAVKPGDVVTAKNGKTIEVINTDAEGRLVLADALVYAQKFNGEYTIDVATLTGACITAIGYNYTGLFTEDDKLGVMLLNAGVDSKDYAWHLPMDSDFHKVMLKSNVADISNSSEGAQGAGATNGAIFLKEFAPENGWAHLDIAGVSEVRGSGNPTGRPVGLITEFMHSLINKKKD